MKHTTEYLTYRLRSKRWERDGIGIPVNNYDEIDPRVAMNVDDGAVSLANLGGGLCITVDVMMYSAEMMMMMMRSSNSVRFYLQEMFNTFTKDLKHHNSFFCLR